MSDCRFQIQFRYEFRGYRELDSKRGHRILFNRNSPILKLVAFPIIHIDYNDQYESILSFFFFFLLSFFLQISRTAKTALYPVEEYVIFSIVFPIVETVRLSIDVEIEWISEVPLFIFAIAIEKDVHT